MATLEINGKRVQVDDGFLQLSPEEQQRTVQQIASQMGGATPAPQTPEAPNLTFGQKVYENFIGSGEVDTPGERLGQMIRGGTAAVARGIADVPAIPANLLQLGAMGYEKATGATEPSALSRGLNALPDTRGLLSSVPVIGPESEYVAPGKAGEYISTAGEFAGGAGGMSLLSKGGNVAGNMLRYGVAPGLASEGAGQLTEGTAIEPYARAAAGIGTSLLTGPRAPTFAGDDEAARMANLLQREGVRNITAGQARGNANLMRAEGRLQATPSQLDDFTASTMRQLGSTEKLATPSNLRAVERTLVSQMDDALSGVKVTPAPNQASRALQVSADYIDRVPAGSLTPRIRGIANEIRSLAAGQREVPLSRLREWRSDIGRLSVSPDAATREAAHNLRGLIDDMTDSALTAAGRSGDIAKLGQARQSYRDYIAVRDAASRAGAEGGTLSPTALNQSVIRSQGREAYATGRTTPMAEFTRAGASTLRSAPTVNPGGVRSISEALPLTGAAIMGGGALQAGADPMMAALLAAGGTLAPAAAQSAMRSNTMQTLLKNPAALARQPIPTLPGLLSQE